MKVKTTLTEKGRPKKGGAVGEFASLADAVLFAGQYMRAVPLPHRNVTAVKIELVPERKRRA